EPPVLVRPVEQVYRTPAGEVGQLPREPRDRARGSEREAELVEDAGNRSNATQVVTLRRGLLRRREPPLELPRADTDELRELCLRHLGALGQPGDDLFPGVVVRDGLVLGDRSARLCQR